MPTGLTMHIEKIAEELARTGYIVLDNPLPDALSAKLLSRCQDNDGQRFHAARVGRGSARRRVDAIRGDVISWLDGADDIDQAYLGWMEQLRTGLNAALYLGLFDYECHYAIYEAGAGYAKHSDVLQGGSCATRNRILSTVFYLNENWQACDGGELVLFETTGNSVIATVNPNFGKMVIFLSDVFPHQVLMASKERRSIAGWFSAREAR